MKRTLSLLAALLLVPAVAVSAADAPKPATKPNILLIYSDDHGWADIGLQGADSDVRTPQLDRLARDGVLFKRGYVTAPQCAPSRAGVITGRYQQRFGLEDNKSGPLPLSELTIAERLKPAGYVSGFVGKSHLDLDSDKKSTRVSRVNKDHLPHAQGFDEYWRGERGQFFASHALDGTPFPDAPRLVTDNRFRVVVQTEAALSFLDRRAAKPDQPWFLYLAWFAPHVPLESPEPWFGRTPAHLPLERRQALAMIAAMDDGLGRIREKLRAAGQEQNTLIFFIGDNGAPLGNVWNGSINKPLNGQKGMLSDGGIRVPFVAAWPGRLPAGQEYDQPVSSLDVAATAVKAAGIEAPIAVATSATALDGVNLLPFLTGENKAAPHDALFWRWGSQAAVLEMPYKLIALGNRERLLFDVTVPDGENAERNLIAKHPEIAARLEASLTAWAAGLQPPGLPTSFDSHHEDLFAEHRMIARADGQESQAALKGWVCRNGTLTVKDGVLHIARGDDSPKDARTFLAIANIDHDGPVAVTMKVRATTGGASAFSWRSDRQTDFLPENVVGFDWPASAEWREVKADLPVTGRLIHLRITPFKQAAGLEVQSVELRGKNGTTRTWKFDDAK